MTSNPLQPNIRELQQDVVELLQNISQLMGSASETLRADSSGEKYQSFQKEIDQAIKNVENLELRMAIVAPMKAGKSTIINAIVGQDLLPSRNAAMTTLPTEILLDSTNTQPILELSQDLSNIIVNTFFAIRNKIQQTNPNQVNQQLKQHPHLQKLIENIKNKPQGTIQTGITGQKRIINNLTGINDLIRLCNLLDPLSDPLQYLEDFPRILTCPWQSDITESSKLLGKLVIVDTPGPNEAGEHLHLKDVVSKQLQKSSLVLLVLDFTQLKTEAAEKVRQEVQKVVSLRGKENLYVLINKVDQRRTGDMTSEDVEKFVAGEFDISNSKQTKRIFEISARQAFSAAKFLQELRVNPNFEITTSNSAQALAQEVFGIDWEEDLEDTTLEQLEKKAHRLWKKSGFDLFLQEAVNALIQEAAPRCMESALNTAYHHVIQLKDSANLRCKAILEDAEKVKIEVKRLSKDIKELQKIRETIQKEVDIKKRGLSKNLSNKSNKLKAKSEEALQHYFLEELQQRINKSKSLGEKLDLVARKLLIKPIKLPFGLNNPLEDIVPQSISKLLKYDFILNGINTIEFQTQEEAQEFADQTFLEAKQIVTLLLNQAFSDLKDTISLVKYDLDRLLQWETKVIIEQARSRLNKTFDINLSLPILILDDIQIDSVSVEIEINTHKKSFFEKISSFFRYLFTEKKTEDRQTYVVSLKKIVEQVNELIKIKVDEIDLKISNYLSNDFNQQTQNFFQHLDNYLKSYQDDLTQTLQAQDTSLENQEYVRITFDSFLEKSNIFLKEIEKNQEFLVKFKIVPK